MPFAWGSTLVVVACLALQPGTLPPRAEAATTGWRGGTLATHTGETVSVYVSDAYSQEQVDPQAWADFFASLPHGRELSSVVIRVAPHAEVEQLCAPGALGCYRRSELVLAGETVGGMTPESIARHEYGHHVAANRVNPPWQAVDWGTKRWASATQVCTRAKAGTAFPGDEADRYRLNPGEAFAEAFRVLAEQKAGSALSSWSIVDGSFYPDAPALRALEEDVVRPWTKPWRKTARRLFRANGPRRLNQPVVTPLDGELTAELKLPAGRLDTLELLDSAGRVLARGLWAGTSTRKLTFVVCGQRRLTLRVTRLGGPGGFALAYGAP